jgi:RHS repeat-associated protein
LALTGQAGTVDTTYRYSPFGNTVIGGSNANPFQYAGRENDESGLYYYRTRSYNPQLERFVSEDQVEHVNLYQYVDNNPVRFRDPLGAEKNGPLSSQGYRCTELGCLPPIDPCYTGQGCWRGPDPTKTFGCDIYHPWLCIDSGNDPVRAFDALENLWLLNTLRMCTTVDIEACAEIPVELDLYLSRHVASYALAHLPSPPNYYQNGAVSMPSSEPTYSNWSNY